MIRYIIPSLKDSAQPDRLCPRCNTLTGRIHQHRSYSVVDTRIGLVNKLRIQCSICRTTWTCQPEGLKPHFQRSQRLQALNILLYALGLGYRAVAAVATAIGAPESHCSVYRDLRDSMDKVKQLRNRGERKVRVAGIDGTYQKLAEPAKSRQESLIFVVDFQDGGLIEVELLDEKDAQQVAGLIKDLQAKLGVELWVSDEHNSYSQAIEPARHLLCTTHFKKNKLRRVNELKEEARSERMKQDLEELEGLLRDPPPDGKQKAGEIYRRQPKVRRPRKGKRASVGSRLKELAREIYEKWDKVWQQTNNATERAIGLCLKIRSKLMRGFKVAEHITGFAEIRGWMYQQGQRVEMGLLV